MLFIHDPDKLLHLRLGEELRLVHDDAVIVVQVHLIQFLHIQAGS